MTMMKPQLHLKHGQLQTTPLVWNYNMDEAPWGEPLHLSVNDPQAGLTVHDGMRLADGRWSFPNAYAWMPLPDPAPLPEVTA